MAVHNHWSDGLARAVMQRIRQRGNDPSAAICAAGISPSGTVHIGNFREIITVDLIVRALKDAGVETEFLYFWDDYDALRAIPRTIETDDSAAWGEAHLRKPLSAIPDPYQRAESYARRNETAIETLLPRLGIHPRYIYQSQQYQAYSYAAMMRRALEERAAIRAILNQHRHTPLEDDWWPLTIYSSFNGKDTTAITAWDGEWQITYRCQETEQSESIDLRSSGNAKLRWRVDWPMRWAYSGVDFEPAGKDHHTEGGSYDTAAQIATRVFKAQPPISVQYDFIRIKGGSGKMSSSTGELLSVGEVLAVYQPEVLRYLFASTRPNVEFAISFDVDVIKIYEDYDKCERIACGAEPSISEKRIAKERRIYELSKIDAGSTDSADATPAVAPPHAVVDGVPDLAAADLAAADLAAHRCLQIAFRRLCNVLQMYSGDIGQALATFPEYQQMSTAAQARTRTRSECAWSWVTEHAPSNFRFQLSDPGAPHADVSGGGGDRLTDRERAALQRVAELVADPDRFPSSGTVGAAATDGAAADSSPADGTAAADGMAAASSPAEDDKELHNALYAIANESQLPFRDLCRMLYRVMIDRDDGPRLAHFMLLIGQERLLCYFNPERIKEM